MTNPPTFLILQETGPMLFADCPFCLAPLPMDLATGSMDCADCGVHLVLADDAPLAAVASRVPVAAPVALVPAA